jgi:lipopolysaccharide export system permease protein
MTLFDRLLIWSYIKSYLVCLVSLVGLFIVVDLFTNMDRFSEENATVGGVLHQVVRYYSIKVTQIFDRLCEPIVLCAAMFTVAWMQRNNEMLPLLSAGVSTRRIVRPVLFSAFLMLGLAILNQELVLPNIDWYYAENGRDPAGEKACFVQGAYEGNGIHISGNVGYRKELLIREFFVVIPAKINRDNITFLQSKEARYIPPGTAELSGGWLLTQTTPAEIQGWSRNDVLVPITPGTYFLHTKEVDFDVITRPNSWFIYVSTLDLLKELGRTHNSKVAAVAVIFHMRLTRPILGMLLVFMGLSIILRDQNRNVFISAGMCLVLCGIFFMALFFCKSLGDREYLSPALAAWIPVGAFFPVSLVMFDAVHT